jgi:hypothetical protein
MLVVDHGVERRKRSKLCRRDLSRARAVLSHALLRACDGRLDAKTVRRRARRPSSVRRR